MNPCPCGFFSDPKHACRCTYQQIHRYRAKISGPLMDRIDLHVEVPAVDYRDLMAAARRLQTERFANSRAFCNAQMGSRQTNRHCRLDAATTTLLEAAVDRLGLSARAFKRVLKIARTIADLAGAPAIGVEHVSEAVQYRSLDRGKRLA